MAANDLLHPDQAAASSVIGERVASARRRRDRGWKQETLAEKLARSERWVRQLESGELPWLQDLEDGRSPSPREMRMLTPLCAALELELADLIRVTGVVSPAAVREPAGTAPWIRRLG